MNKLAIIPIFFLTMCGTAPVTPPAGACSLPLDGSSANCPTTWPIDVEPKEELRGEIDIYEPMHWHSINQMFIRSQRRKRIEENATSPEDALNNALGDFNWEVIDGSNGST